MPSGGDCIRSPSIPQHQGQLAVSEKVVFHRAQLEEQLGGGGCRGRWLAEDRGLGHHRAHFQLCRPSWGGGQDSSPQHQVRGPSFLGGGTSGLPGCRAEAPGSALEGKAETSARAWPTVELRDLTDHLPFPMWTPWGGDLAMVTQRLVTGSERMQSDNFGNLGGQALSQERPCDVSLSIYWSQAGPGMSAFREELGLRLGSLLGGGPRGR